MSRFEYVYKWIVWNLTSYVFCRYLRLSYRIGIAKGSDRLPKPPFLIIANHGTFFDPWIACHYSIHPVAIMCNDDAFRGSAFSRWYLRSIGAFPKKKGASDFKAMKTVIAKLKQKIPVCIFPEGQTTWDGETQLIYKGIERIIKKTGCPVVSMRLQGNFLTKPWWAQTKRTGRVRISVKVLSREMVVAKSSEEIFDFMKRSVYQNEIRDPENLAVPFRGDDVALGVERLLWMCPHCEAEDRIATHGNIILCEACNTSWTMDAHCCLSSEKGRFQDLKAWADWQREKVLERIKDSRSTLTSPVECTLYSEDEAKKFAPRSQGHLSVTREALEFRGEGQNLLIPVAAIENQVIQQKDIFECTFQGSIYRFLFDKKSPMKWIYYVRYLKGYEECERRGYLE